MKTKLLKDQMSGYPNLYEFETEDFRLHAWIGCGGIHGDVWCDPHNMELAALNQLKPEIERIKQSKLQESRRAGDGMN